MMKIAICPPVKRELKKPFANALVKDSLQVKKASTCKMQGLGFFFGGGDLFFFLQSVS